MNIFLIIVAIVFLILAAIVSLLATLAKGESDMNVAHIWSTVLRWVLAALTALAVTALIVERFPQ